MSASRPSGNLPAHNASHLGNYVFHNPGTAQAFRDAIHDGINSVPVPIHEALAYECCSIVTGDRITAFIPQVIGGQPPGYPPAATYDWSRGVFEHLSRTIAIAARYFDPVTGQFEDNDVVQGHLRHEAGHALYVVLHGVQTDLRLVNAYTAESQAIADPLDYALLSYYLQPGVLGIREVFSEAFAIIHGGGADETPIQNRLQQLFPQTFLAVQDIVQGI